MSCAIVNYANLIIIEFFTIVEEKKSLLQINKDLNKNLQELEIKLADTSDELKKTKEALEVAKNTIKQCRDDNVHLEDKLSECNKEHILQTDAIFSKQKDVIFSNCTFCFLSPLLLFIQYAYFIYR